MSDSDLAAALTADFPEDERDRLTEVIQRATKEQLAEARAAEPPRRGKRGR